MTWIGRVVSLLAVVSVAMAAAAYLAYQEAREPFKGYPGKGVFFKVSSGASSGAIARKLEADGIIKDAQLFLAALRLRGAAGRLQAGEYWFENEVALVEVIDRLVAGDVFYRSVTIPEGLTLWETAKLLSDKGFGDAEALSSAFERGSLIASVDPDAENLEGYLFPETYRFPRDPSPDDVAGVFVSRFLHVFDGARRARAEELGLDVRQVVTLASVVEKETGRADERPVIASVFWNRLKRRMPLQSDPTIIYDLKRRGQFDGNLRRRDLRSDSAYNTYTRPGLPRGPIASPGRAAIDAVLNPAETNYLYFVSRNDGSHHFSASLREHNAAVRKYQIDYFRLRRRS